MSDSVVRHPCHFTDMSESRVLELFGNSTRLAAGVDWQSEVKKQCCPFTNTKCFKVRKSQPEISISTCSARYGQENKDVIICPNRLLERKQVFTGHGSFGHLRCKSIRLRLAVIEPIL